MDLQNFEKNFKSLFPKKRLLAVKLDGFSHSAWYDSGNADSEVEQLWFSACAPESLHNTGKQATVRKISTLLLSGQSGQSYLGCTGKQVKEIINMKNTKELQSILTAIHCINYTSEHSDSDIHKIVDYAFRRLFGANTNLITLCCIGKTKEQIMPEIMQVLEADTQYKQYLKEFKENK